jgi:hypothetical protein
MRASSFALLLLAGPTFVACADPASEPAGQDPTSNTATAVIALERTAGAGDAPRSDAVVARFVRVRQGAVDDPALRIAGVAEDIPALGACAAPTESPTALQGRSVELLDVGQVMLSTDTAAKSTVLVPRSMPDPAGVVSGVFYSARAADVFSSGSRVLLRSLGGLDLADGFAVSATAPREINDVHVATTTSGLDVAWDPIDIDSRDLFYVEVLSPAPRVAVRCTSADGAHVVIPQSALGGIDDGQIAIHRIHKESFKAKGIEPGEVRFDVAKLVTFRR